MERAVASLAWTPLLPVAVLYALAVIGVLAAAAGLALRSRGAWFRAATVAVMLGWLAGPRLVQEQRETLPDVALLAVDRTESMSVGDRAATAASVASGIARAAAGVPNLELRTIDVAESGSDGTLLFGAIDRALADIPAERLAGVIAVTDGQAHDVPADGPGEPTSAAPLHALIAAAGEETDRRIRVIEAPGFGIVGKSVTVRLVVEDLGVKPGAGPASARLSVRRDDESARERVVQVGREVSLDLPIQRAGPSVVSIEVEALTGEASARNNRAVLTINGVRDRLRVLLVSGEPHPGERTWRRLLKADPSVDLVHFTILRPPERDDMTPLNELALIAFPVRELFQVKLREFDLVILDRYQNRGLLPLPYLRNIADYVRDGGALLVSAGPEFSGAGSLAAGPLGEVLPARPRPGGGPLGAVVDGAFRPEVTALGARHPVTAGLTMPWGEWFRRVAVTDVGGEAVMAAPDGAPLLLLDRVGQGRAALLLSDQIWLWSRGHDGGGPQAELLRRLAHWLMAEPELEEDALEARAEGGRLMVTRRSLVAGPPTTLAITDPDGGVTRAPMRASDEAAGTETLDVAAGREGVWRVGDGTRRAFAAVGPANPRELSDLRATATVMEPAARRSGGGAQFVRPRASGGAARVPELRMVEADRRAAGEGWIGLRRRHAHVVTGVASVPLLPAGAALPLMLGLVVLAWRREGT